MRLACIAYRDWALAIYDHLARHTNHTILIVRSKEQYDEQALIDFRPDRILFYGWSWKISRQILDLAPCVMLHPAPLPLYRGGSPIQNQIIAGERRSAVTLFQMSEEMDAGDILAQDHLDLDGHLDDIFARITQIGIDQTMRILIDWPRPRPQDHARATYCTRRKPADSEITTEELRTKPGQYLYDKIRMLEAPYPNAFITTADGRKLVIKRAELED